jgi:YhcG PDDEXK nuclease domain
MRVFPFNYARAHWMQPGENPPVGLILCSQKNAAAARYALEGLQSEVLAREYRLALPKGGRHRRAGMLPNRGGRPFHTCDS